MKRFNLSKKQRYYFGGLATFTVLILGAYIYHTPSPRLLVFDQPIIDGQINVKQINLPFDGWIILFSTEYDQPTEMVGKIRVERGRNRNIGVFVNVLRVTPRVLVSIYEDKTTPGIFDAQNDQEVLAEGKPLSAIINKQ
jgi:hypothetical protein